jgi:hypothetical protein
VPDIPALVEVPHTFTAKYGMQCAAHALNESAKLAAIHALHVAAIAAGSCKTVQRALCDSYVQIERAMREEYSMAMWHGGLLYAWHGTKAFEVHE